MIITFENFNRLSIRKLFKMLRIQAFCIATNNRKYYKIKRKLEKTNSKFVCSMRYHDLVRDMIVCKSNFSIRPNDISSLEYERSCV